jgi:hypothetical protein
MSKSQSLDKFKIDEQIKKSYLKNLGDTSLILREVRLPEEYVLSRIDKIRKTESGRERSEVAEGIMGYISVGYRARRIRILEMLSSLEGAEQCQVSVCHKAPVMLREDSFEDWHECLYCHKRTETRVASYMDIYRLKKELLTELREEDKHLMAFAEKMGYTKINTPGVVNQIKQNVFVMGKDKNKDTIDVSDMPKDLDSLSPMDRQRFIDNLTKEILRLEQLEDTSEQPTGQIAETKDNPGPATA